MSEFAVQGCGVGAGRGRERFGGAELGGACGGATVLLLLGTEGGAVAGGGSGMLCGAGELLWSNRAPPAEDGCAVHDDGGS